MRIREKHYDFDVEVYGIYWVDKSMYVLVIPYEGYEGFDAVPESKYEITENHIDNFVYFKSSYGGDALLHRAAAEDDLIYKLIDHQPDAMAEFLRRLESYPPLSDDHGTEKCPCCLRKTLNSSGCYETCPVCGWIDDPIQSEDPSYPGGENVLSLKDARLAFAQTGDSSTADQGRS